MFEENEEFSKQINEMRQGLVAALEDAKPVMERKRQKRVDRQNNLQNRQMRDKK